MALTPMMQQYMKIKEEYADSILLFRLGDFYEMFFEDAKIASRELELTLTGKDCGEEERAPMCGIPYHAVENYLGRLVSKGYKVAICEQTEDPALAKDIVRREVIRVVTPGTVFESELLPNDKNNYIASVCVDSGRAGITFADVSTGEIIATEVEGVRLEPLILNELATYSPKELLLNFPTAGYKDLSEYIKGQNVFVGDLARDYFDPDRAGSELAKLNGGLPDVSGIPSGGRALIRSAGALVGYLSDTQKTDLGYFNKLAVYTSAQFLEIDRSTRRNLELTENMRSKDRKNTLLAVINKTKTSMGNRLLASWVEKPLINTYYITRRQKAVAELYDAYMLRSELGETLRNAGDLERLLTKVVYGTANGRDLNAIADTLAVVPRLKALLAECGSDELSGIRDGIDELTDIYTLIKRGIIDEPPFSIREGGFIRAGFSKDIDELRDVITNGKSYVEKLEETEREKTGIKKLRVGYNRVFGYYIEVLRSNTEPIPDYYVRKQTLTNCERYITDDLKKLEATILGASDRIASLEYDAFELIRQEVSNRGERIRKTAEKLARLDVYYSLAEAAVKNNYCAPEVDYSDVIDIKDGRHPVVELVVRDSYFVPNDTYLNTSSDRLMLITGPNMAGKSTYMRQVALIVILAQIGSFVPAREARIGIVDKIFTRIGASDDLASGQSTFMLEMNEVAYILKNATKKSLVIYDEIGRGTSTFDGMSIARAVAEYTAGKKIGAKTLFATHYHELTDLEEKLDGVRNYNIAAKKKGDTLTFLRKIVRGKTDDSYGIEVASLAGVPSAVIKRAKEVLTDLENGSRPVSVSPAAKPDEGEISFDSVISESLADELRSLDLNVMTPIEALSYLYELKKKL